MQRFAYFYLRSYCSLHYSLSMLKTPNKKKAALTVSLDRALLTAARDSARAEDISTAALVRRAIREYLKARADKEAA